MRIGVLAETAPRERRVALTPDVVRRLIERGHRVTVAPEAGRGSGMSPGDYLEAGADVDDPIGADLHAFVTGPSDLTIFPTGTAVVGLMAPFDEPQRMKEAAEAGLTALALEGLPRVTRAQTMDALTSQATVAGYRAVIEAAGHLGKLFPMLTTAAGTIRPAKVLVLGAGVAGLQAVATARRLGAVVSAYDVRPAAAEQVESLGARFLDLQMMGEQDAAGYARELGEDQQRRALEALSPYVAESDVVISTAQIPGRPAPLLITTEMIERMSPGSVVVDLAAATGGNCQLTVADEEVRHDDVVILGPTDLPSRVAVHASQMYARNLESLIEHLSSEGELAIDLDDEIIAGCCMTHQGRIVHPSLSEGS